MPTDKEKREYRQLFEASAVGWMFPVSIGVGFGWGYLMDRWFGTWPWLSGIFAFFGIVAAFINLFRFAGKNGGE